MGTRFIARVSKSKFLAIAIFAKVLSAYVVLADTSSVDYIFLLNSEQPTCQQIGDNYLEIRAFETENFYINVCRKGDQYYYLGESKQGKQNTIFLPANSLSLGEMYRAHNGNVSYIVNILPHQAILTIERNGEQVTVESSEIYNQCSLQYDQSRSASQVIFKYPERYLNSYATVLPYQRLSLLNSIPIFENYSFLDVNYFQSFYSSKILNLPNCN